MSENNENDISDTKEFPVQPMPLPGGADQFPPPRPGMIPPNIRPNDVQMGMRPPGRFPPPVRVTIAIFIILFMIILFNLIQNSQPDVVYRTTSTE